MQIIRCSNPPPTAWVHSTVGSCDVTADVCWASVWHLWNHLQPWPPASSHQLASSPHRSPHCSPHPLETSPPYHLTVLETSPLQVTTSLFWKYPTSLLTSPFWKHLHFTSYHLTVLETSQPHQKELHISPHPSRNISTSTLPPHCSILKTSQPQPRYQMIRAIYHIIL